MVRQLCSGEGMAQDMVRDGETGKGLPGGCTAACEGRARGEILAAPPPSAQHLMLPCAYLVSAMCR